MSETRKGSSPVGEKNPQRVSQPIAPSADLPQAPGGDPASDTILDSSATLQEERFVLGGEDDTQQVSSPFSFSEESGASSSGERERISQSGSGMRRAAASEEAAPDSLLGAVLLNYRITAKIAEGGMGIVYRAEHISLGRPAAIKVLRLEYCQNEITIKRFYQEGRLVNQIKHRNIIDVFDFGRTEDGRVFYIMELLQGESLAERLKRAGPFSLAEALPVMEQAVEALLAVHEQGIIHRDLKPENLWLTGGEAEVPLVKLLDFGIAKLVGLEGIQEKITKTGSIIGTPQYMSPEQIQGQAIDVRSDVYSLGMVFYEMLVGRTPFEKKTLGQILAMHLSGDMGEIPRALEELGAPDGVRALVTRALARNPEDRYPSMREVLSDLRALSSGQPLRAALPPGPSPEAPREALSPTPISGPGGRGRLRVLLVALFMALSVVAFGVIGVVLWQAFVTPSEQETLSSEHANAGASLDEGALRQAALDLLQESLRQPSPRVRAAAARGLGEVGDRGSQPRLSALLSDAGEDIEVRLSAAFGLGMLGGPSSRAALEKASSGAEGRLKVAIDAALLRLGESAARERLLASASSAEADICLEAALGLIGGGALTEAEKVLRQVDSSGLLPEKKLILLRERARLGDKEALGLLKKILNAPGSAERLLSASALAELGYDAGRGELLEALSSEDAAHRIKAASSLLYLGDLSGLAPLKEELRGKDPGQRAEAARALGLLGEREVVSLLAPLLQDSDGQVQVEAAVGLLMILGLSEDLASLSDLAWLDEMLAASDAKTRAQAVRILAEMEGEEALTRVTGVLMGPDKEMAKAAAMALLDRAMEEQDGQAMEKLTALAGNTEKSMQVISQAAMAAKGDEDARQGLMAAASDKQEAVREMALQMATKLGDLEVLAKGLTDRSPEIRLEAAIALAERGDLSGQQILVEAARSGDLAKSSRAKAALMAAGAEVDADALALSALLDSQDPALRALGASLSGVFPNEAGKEALRRALFDAAPEVRLAAIKAAEARGEASLLRLLVRDQDPAVRAAATLALARLSEKTSEPPASPTSSPTPAPSPSIEEAPREEPKESLLAEDEKLKRLRESELKMGQGDVALAAGRAGQALKLYMEAHRLSPRADISWFYGECYRRLGDAARKPEDQVRHWKKAKSSYESFAKKRPKDPRSAKAKRFAAELGGKIKAFGP